MKRFLISSLAAAGFLANQAHSAPAAVNLFDSDQGQSLFERLKLDHVFSLAGHSSHRSHASHRSHTSHRSSTGGYSFSPRPLYTPPPVYAPPPIISPAPLLTLPGNSGKFTEIARQVQLALQAYGYYEGAIDGVIGPKAREALRLFQTHYGLEVTGTITPEVLDSLGILAK